MGIPLSFLRNCIAGLIDLSEGKAVHHKVKVRSMRTKALIDSSSPYSFVTKRFFDEHMIDKRLIHIQESSFRGLRDAEVTPEI